MLCWSTPGDQVLIDRLKSGNHCQIGSEKLNYLLGRRGAECKTGLRNEYFETVPWNLRLHDLQGWGSKAKQKIKYVWTLTFTWHQVIPFRATVHPDNGQVVTWLLNLCPVMTTMLKSQPGQQILNPSQCKPPAQIYLSLLCLLRFLVAQCQISCTK